MGTDTIWPAGTYDVWLLVNHFPCYLSALCWICWWTRYGSVYGCTQPRNTKIVFCLLYELLVIISLIPKWNFIPQLSDLTLAVASQYMYLCYRWMLCISWYSVFVDSSLPGLPVFCWRMVYISRGRFHNCIFVAYISHLLHITFMYSPIQFN